MTTPTKEEVRQKAQEMYQELNQHLPRISAEEYELKESGIWQEARDSLMRDNEKAEYASYIEQEARSLGLLDDKVEPVEQTKPFSFDVQEALRNGAYISGTTGQGKSDLAMMHAESMMKQDITVLVFDASQDWIKRSSIPYYITIEPDVTFRYELNKKSLVFDMSLLTPQQQKNLVKEVCQRIWNHQVTMGSHWYYLIFEEGHLYFPQGCLRSKEYAGLVQLATEGRNYKIRFEVITQFASLIDKDIMKFMNQRFFGASNEPNDLKYLRKFLGEDAEKLKSLASGQFVYYCRNKTTLTEIEPFQSQKKSEPLRYSVEKTEKLNETQITSQPNISSMAVLMQLVALVIFMLALLLTLSYV